LSAHRTHKDWYAVSPRCEQIKWTASLMSIFPWRQDISKSKKRDRSLRNFSF
jgi:hypothetical protein